MTHERGQQGGDWLWETGRQGKAMGENLDNCNRTQLKINI